MRRLDDEFEIGPARKRLSDVVGAMADDKDRPGRLERIHGPEDMLDERTAGQGMQDLGARRLHARPFPGREDDDVELHL